MSQLYLDVRTPDVHTNVPELSAQPTLPVLDRASLRVGLWLLLRSARRADDRADRVAHARRRTAQDRRLDRETTAARLALLAPRL